VFLVAVSNVRMPRSQRITFGFPPAMMYSALIRSSSTVFASPRLSRIGFRVMPSSFKSSKFCMLRAPTCITSTFSNSGSADTSMISVTTGSPVSRFASSKRSMPFACSP